VTVAALSSPEDGSRLVGMLEALRSAGIDAYALKLHPGWVELPPDKLFARLGRASHLLLVASRASLGSAWLAFAAGFGYGKGSGIAVYRLDPGIALPRMLGSMPVIDGLEELAAYYAAEKDEWVALETRRQARARLLEMGISCHADALAQCASEGDAKSVALFIDAGFNPDTRDKRGVPLLCLATRGKHLAVAELLLDRGASIDLQSEDRGYSALMDAAQAGAAELAKLFLARGANPDILSKDSQTALIVSVGRNDAAISRLLLEGGADPDVADKLGLSARKYAGLFKNEAIASLIESRSPKPPATPAKPA
jgi:uncharacterized protein